MKYIIGICDDETIQLKVNTVYIKEVAKRNNIPIVLKTFCNSSQLFSYLNENSLDILFLDIDLGEESGIDIAKKLAVKYPNILIIFLTGHREYTNDAFEVDALGYLVKPLNEQRLERTLNRAITHVCGIQIQSAPPTLSIIENNIKKEINTADILYIKHVHRKSIIYTTVQTYQVYDSITSLCQKLGENFLRINQREIVPRSEIADIIENTVLLRDNRQLTLGRTYKKAVLEILQK